MGRYGEIGRHYRLNWIELWHGNLPSENQHQRKGFIRSIELFYHFQLLRKHKHKESNNFLQTPSNNLLQSTWSFNQGYLNLLHSKRLDYFRCLRCNNFGMGIIVLKVRKIFFSLLQIFFFLRFSELKLTLIFWCPLWSLIYIIINLIRGTIQNYANRLSTTNSLI